MEMNMDMSMMPPMNMNMNPPGSMNMNMMAVDPGTIMDGNATESQEYLNVICGWEQAVHFK